MKISHPRIALVTGASRSLGLGFAVGRKLAELDHHVILTARTVGQAEDLAAVLRRDGFRATALALDLSDRTSIDRLAVELADAVGHLDVLINNASAMPDFQTRSALDVDLDALQALFAVNVFGCWGLTQALLPLLLQAPAARIVNVTSAAAWQICGRKKGPLFSPAYSLAKYTLNALTITLATALADTPILVNAVDPGSVASHPERGDDDEDRSPAEAAKDVVWAAMLGADGPSGGLFRYPEPLPASAP